MNLTVTERDRKLLVFLAVVILAAALGAGVVYPVMTKAQELRTELQNAREEKTDRELKVANLPAIEQQHKETLAQIQDFQEDAYPMTQSLGVDRILTSLAQAQGAEVKSLDIEMPQNHSYAAFPSYGQVLTAMSNVASGTASGQSQEESTMSYEGVYAAHATMNLSGNRETLQSVLDRVASEEPDFRITEFQWGRNTSQNTVSLTLGVDVYMYEDLTAYLMNQVAAQMESSETNAGDAAGETAAEDADTQEDLTQ